MLVQQRELPTHHIDFVLNLLVPTTFFCWYLTYRSWLVSLVYVRLGPFLISMIYVILTFKSNLVACYNCQKHIYCE